MSSSQLKRNAMPILFVIATLMIAANAFALTTTADVLTKSAGTVNSTVTIKKTAPVHLAESHKTEQKKKKKKKKQRRGSFS